MNKQTAIFFYLFIVSGLFFRIYLAVTLPIWHDEAYSIWASQSSAFDIIRSLVDRVHPPGYYLMLHYWGLISDHLYWFRLTSIIGFFCNTYLLFKIGEQINKKSLPLTLVFLYCFSGYFIIFDWQVRMYTLVLTFILLNIYLLNKYINKEYSSKENAWIYLTILNILGLYIDYGYFWYFFPSIIFFLALYVFSKIKSYLFILLSYLVSGIVFLLIHPSIISSYSRGIEGIKWMGQYLKPSFFIPFFLGTHNNSMFTIISIIVLLLGIVKIMRFKLLSLTVYLLVLSSFVSFAFTYLYSIYFSPLFHVRSLQVIGITTIVIIGLAIDVLGKKYRSVITMTLMISVLTNFVLVFNAIPSSPGRFMLSFFPWKHIINQVDIAKIGSVNYKETRTLPTPLLVWGLKYTLQGKESLPQRVFRYQKIDSKGVDKKCTLFYGSLLELYGCER